MCLKVRNLTFFLFHNRKNNWLSHIAIEEPGEKRYTKWCELVIDEEYIIQNKKQTKD